MDDTKKFADLTLTDLPLIAARLGEMKYEIGDNQTFHTAVHEFVTQLDTAVADWEFTAGLFMHLQGLFESLDKHYAENYGYQTLQGFLRAISKLDDLGPEGERARKHLSSFGAIAHQARNYVITEEG